MLSATTVDQVKAYDDIVSVISDYVSLKKRGRNYLGLCPFHSEKTPSFTVSPEKKIFHCFGCKESGDHISFIQKIENLTFTEAIRHIAQKAGIVVEEDEKNWTPEDKNRELLQSQIVEIRDAFKTHLSKHKSTMDYILKRGITAESVQLFHLGYCPSDLQLENLISQDFPKELIQSTGLTYQTDDGQLKLRFRGRLMFPLIDHKGKTLGFSGRTLDKDSKYAKYMNSEETSLFNKRKMLYGLNVAKSTINKEDAVILMEGFIDVIMAHQFGFSNAVATMGTAITTNHARVLKRFTSHIYLAMDSDRAGQIAIERSYEVLKEFEFQVFVIDFQGKDPADTLLEKGGDYFKQCLENRKSIIEFMIDRTLSETPPQRIEDIPPLLTKLIPMLQHEKNSIIQKHYIQLLSTRLKVDEKLILEKLNKSSYTTYNKREYNNRNKKNKGIRAEESILFILATQCEYREKIIDYLSDGFWITPINKQIAALISVKEAVNKPLLDTISDPELKQHLARILIENDLKESESLEQNWRECLEVLINHKKEKRIDSIRRELKELSDTQDDEKSTSLLRELQELKKGI